MILLTSMVKQLIFPLLPMESCTESLNDGLKTGIFLDQHEVVSLVDDLL